LPHTTHPTTDRTWTREEENRLAEWLLTQRLLFDCGELKEWKAEMLTSKLGPWYRQASESDLDHAFYSTNVELNNAFTVWFNHHRLALGPLTFAEIQEFASNEMALKR
jgi:hypothetical protein